MELTEQPHQFGTQASGASCANRSIGGFGTNSSVGSESLGSSRQDERSRGGSASENREAFRSQQATTNSAELTISLENRENYPDQYASSESNGSHDGIDGTR